MCAGPPEAKGPPEDAHVDAMVLFSLVWTVGATGEIDGRAAFDAFFRCPASGECWPMASQYLRYGQLTAQMSSVLT